MTDSLMVFIYIFILAGFVGFELVSKVPPLLHTPLMSGSNAISGITIVGALLVCGITFQGSNGPLAKILGLLALVLATINVVGGFLVTDRMLEMFKKEKPSGKGRAK
jgi:NAD(P) transhydrogenase subunit alpha